MQANSSSSPGLFDADCVAAALAPYMAEQSVLRAEHSRAYPKACPVGQLPVHLTAMRRGYAAALDELGIRAGDYLLGGGKVREPTC